jgi:NADH-quinone oxidoreductase subunit L
VFGAPEAAAAEAGGRTELVFQVISVMVALLGAVLAWIFYVGKPYLPGNVAEALGGLYRTVFNKYYVDELYAKVFVNPLVNGSTRILWQGIDRKVIDDTVNDAADGARHVSDEVRHMESGNLRSYAGWIAAGAAILIAYMFWEGASR